MIQPKEIQIALQDGSEKTFIISKFPAIQGREIICKYPLSGVPKIGDYAVNEETMVKLMSFVAIPTDSGELRLTTKALIDNHVDDWEALAKIELAMLEYNCSFFRKGILSDFLTRITEKLPHIIQSTLTLLSQQSSKQNKQPFRS
jgi:hypothetical protein